MKTLDRYVVRNFLICAILCLVTLISLRVVADLFFNMDEFTKTRREEEKTFLTVVGQIGTYYAFQSLVYFRDLGGVILVAAAAFTLARMNHTNELTAVLASGVSLRRVLLPIIVCALGLNVLVALDNEVVVPRFKQRLVRSRDDVAGVESYRVRAVTDAKKASWYSNRFHPAAGRLENPLIILRDEQYAPIGRITAPEAVYDSSLRAWVFEPAGADKPALLYLPGMEKLPTTAFIPTLVGPRQLVAHARGQAQNRDLDWSQAKSITGRLMSDEQTGMEMAGRLELAQVDGQVVGTVLREPLFIYVRHNKELACFAASQAVYQGDIPRPGWALVGGRLLYVSDLDPGELALRQSGAGMNYMSTGELTELLQSGQLADPTEAVLTRHCRFADFFNNLLMLLVGVPFILSRERNIKSSAALTVLMVGGVYVTIFLARYVGLSPTLGAWLPVLVFGPVAAVSVEAVKT